MNSKRTLRTTSKPSRGDKNFSYLKKSSSNFTVSYGDSYHQRICTIFIFIYNSSAEDWVCLFVFIHLGLLSFLSTIFCCFSVHELCTFLLIYLTLISLIILKIFIISCNNLWNDQFRELIAIALIDQAVWIVIYRSYLKTWILFSVDWIPHSTYLKYKVFYRKLIWKFWVICFYWGLICYKL